MIGSRIIFGLILEAHIDSINMQRSINMRDWKGPGNYSVYKCCPFVDGGGPTESCPWLVELSAKHPSDLTGSRILELYDQVDCKHIDSVGFHYLYVEKKD